MTGQYKIIIVIVINGCTDLSLGLGYFFSSLIIRVQQASFLFHIAFQIQKRKLACRTLYKQAVGVLGQGSAHCKASTYTQDNTECRHRHLCLEWGFEPMTPAFKGTKTVHALDSAATLIVKKNV
jgi:hypothetical protein